MCRQSQLATSEPALSVSLSTTSAAGGDTASTMGGSHQASSGQLGSGLECDLTDSQSTGELPSQLTFRCAVHVYMYVYLVASDVLILVPADLTITCTCVRKLSIRTL